MGLRRWVWSRLIEDDEGTDEPPELEKADARERPKDHGRKPEGSVCTVLTVSGMCCPSEVPIIEKVLQELHGVQRISANAAARTVRVTHDPGLVASSELVDALNAVALGAREQRPRGKAASPGHRKLLARLAIAAGLWLASLVFNCLEWPVSRRWAALLSVALTSPKVLVRAACAARRLMLDMNVLVVTACAGAIAIESYCEAATVLLLLLLSDCLESRVTEQARGAIQEVLALRPEEAELVSGERVAVHAVPLGAVVVIRQGDLVPVDGVVTSGSAALDESALSGESAPVRKGIGATVLAGTTNVGGYIEVTTTSVAEDSAIARLVLLIEQAQSLRSSAERVVERFARVYTPCILTLALLLMTVPWFVKPEAAPTCFYTTLVLLVIACPCALVISTPVTYLSGIACAATHNILVRGGVHLETLGRTDVVAIDKTGTLTEGAFRVRVFEALGGADSGLWRRLAALEARSSHPVAAAIVAAARERGIEPEGEVNGYRELEGEGVEATVEGQRLCVGNERMAQRMGWTTTCPVDEWAADGGTVIWVGTDTGLLAVLSVADACRREAQETTTTLHAMGLSTVMLTGDGQATADVVGRIVGVNDVRAGLRPDDKISCVLELREGTRTVAMVGDGVNDVPALAASHVGIAMGAAGRAAALEAADVVLMDSDLAKLVVAFRLGRRVLWTVRQNIALSLVSKLAMVIFTLSGLASLWGAVAVDVGAMLAVTLNGSAVMGLRRPRRWPATAAHHAEDDEAASPAAGAGTLGSAFHLEAVITRGCKGRCCAGWANAGARRPRSKNPGVGTLYATPVSPEEGDGPVGLPVPPPPPPIAEAAGLCAGFSGGGNARGRPRRPRAPVAGGLQDSGAPPQADSAPPVPVDPGHGGRGPPSAQLLGRPTAAAAAASGLGGAAPCAMPLGGAL